MRAPKPRRWIVNPAGSLERTPQDPDAATGGGADATDAATRPRPASAPAHGRAASRKRSADGAVICQRGMRRGSERAQTRDAPVVLVGADVVHDRRHRGLSCAARAGVALERPAVDPPAERVANCGTGQAFPFPRASVSCGFNRRDQRKLVFRDVSSVRMRIQSSETGFSNIWAPFARKARLAFYDSSDGNGGYAPGVSMAKKALALLLLPVFLLRSALPTPSSPSSHRAAPSPRNTGATLSAM